MKTIKNIAMIAATVAMMATSINNCYAAPKPEPSIANELMNAPHTMQYYHASDNKQTHRFEYTVDAQGRVTDKVRYDWDSETATWHPVNQYHVSFGADGHKLTFGSWDDATNDFSKNVVSQHYDANAFPIVINLPEEAF